MLVEQFSPAKLNLRLKVTGRDARGYHLLSMLNVPLAFGDALQLVCTRGDSKITGSFQVADRIKTDEAFWDSSSNLALKAARGLQDLLADQYSFEIRLNKNIPIGAGLAGGSSNAAAVLNAFYKATQLYAELSKSLKNTATLKADLLQIAEGLGADVPFFLHGQSAWVGGIGEQIYPIAEELSGLPILLIFLPVHANTSSVYSALRNQSASNKFGADSKFRSSIKEPSSLFALLENDLLPVAASLYQELSDFDFELRRLMPGRCGMSGSGSTFFALPADLVEFSGEERRAVARLAKEQGAELFYTQIAPFSAIFS